MIVSCCFCGDHSEPMTFNRNLAGFACFDARACLARHRERQQARVEAAGADANELLYDSPKGAIS